MGFGLNTSPKAVGKYICNILPFHRQMTKIIRIKPRFSMTIYCCVVYSVTFSLCKIAKLLFRVI